MEVWKLHRNFIGITAVLMQAKPRDEVAKGPPVH